MYDWMSNLGTMLGNFGGGGCANGSCGFTPPATPAYTPSPAFAGGYIPNMPQNPAVPVGMQRPHEPGLSDLLHSREQLAIALDMAGQAFDPNNVAAGTGTWLAQASLMNKANKETAARGGGGGGASSGKGGTHVSVQPMKGNKHQQLIDLLSQDHTPQGQEGMTTSNLKRDSKGWNLTLNGSSLDSLLESLSGKSEGSSPSIPPFRNLSHPEYGDGTGASKGLPADWHGIQVHPSSAGRQQVPANTGALSSYSYGGSNLNPW